MSNIHHFEMTCELDQSGVAVVWCAGAIDSSTYKDLDAKLKKLFSCGCHQIIIDLSSLTYMTSPGGGALVCALAKAEEFDGKIVLVNPNLNVRALFDLIGLSDLIEIAPDLRAALTLFPERVHAHELALH